MRAQPGTSSLRAILYMDEIFGYFPPVAKPPSKRPLLTLLKQARAFGLGVVLATQNPVDLDYKGLSNAGTWFIGRLQTERDKAAAARRAGGRRPRPGAFDRGADGADPRRARQARVPDEQRARRPRRSCSRRAGRCRTCAGRSTRDQIRTLMTGRAPAAAAADAAAAPAAAAAHRPRGAAPAPRRVRRSRPTSPRYYVPRRGTPPAGASLHYVPMTIGSASVRIGSTSSDVTLLAPLSDGAVTLTWDGAVDAGVAADDLGSAPEGDASYGEVPAAARTKRAYATWSRDLGDWLYRTQEVTVYKSARFKETSLPGESEGDFRNRLSVAAREERDAAVEKLRVKFAAKHATLQERIRKAEQAVSREAEQARGAKVQTAISLGSSILGAFLGRRKNVSGATTVLRGVGRSVDQAGDTTRARETVAALQAQDAELDREFTAATQELDRSFDPVAEPLETVAVRPEEGRHRRPPRGAGLRAALARLGRRTDGGVAMSRFDHLRVKPGSKVRLGDHDPGNRGSATTRRPTRPPPPPSTPSAWSS